MDCLSSDYLVLRTEQHIPEDRSLFCFHFLFIGKDKTAGQSWEVPSTFLTISAAYVLPSHLSFSTSIRPSVFEHTFSHLIWIISFDSNYILLYCAILHFDIIFSKSTFLLRWLPLFYFRPIYLPFSHFLLSQGMGPWVLLPH